MSDQHQEQPGATERRKNKGNPEMDQIVTRDSIRAIAREDHARGVGRDEHGFNWHSPALADWQKEWDRCEAAKRNQAELEAA